MNRNIFPIRYLFLLILIVTGGCSSLSQTVSTPSPAATIQQITSATPTATALPTPTSLPPITVDNAMGVMTNFLRKNGGCELPCLLGLNPGSSEPASVKALMEYFQENTMETDSFALGESVDEGSGRAYLIFQKSDEQVFFNFSYYNDQSGLDVLTLTGVTYSLSDHLVDFTAPYGIELVEYYLLPNILTLYGSPSDVMILPLPTDPNRLRESYQFSLVLYYKEKGFLVEYISLKQEQGEYFTGCQPTSYVNLVSWSSGRQRSLPEIVARLGSEGINTLNIDFFKELEDVTALTIPEFYEAFKTLDEPKCVLTPKELWPEPVLAP